jgi:hypothetical protein
VGEGEQRGAERERERERERGEGKKTHTHTYTHTQKVKERTPKIWNSNDLSVELSSYPQGMFGVWSLGMRIVAVCSPQLREHHKRISYLFVVVSCVLSTQEISTTFMELL